MAKKVLAGFVVGACMASSFALLGATKTVSLEAWGKPDNGWEFYTKAQDFSGATHLSSTMTFWK